MKRAHCGRLTRATLAGLLGISPSNVSQIENLATASARHKRRPDLNRVKTWAAACGYEANLAFFPAQHQPEVTARQIAGLPPVARRVAELVVELGPAAPPLLLEELEARLEAWRGELPRWRQYDRSGHPAPAEE